VVKVGLARWHAGTKTKRFFAAKQADLPNLRALFRNSGPSCASEGERKTRDGDSVLVNGAPLLVRHMRTGQARKSSRPRRQMSVNAWLAPCGFRPGPVCSQAFFHFRPFQPFQVPPLLFTPISSPCLLSDEHISSKPSPPSRHSRRQMRRPKHEFWF
jgi:hypothetical protein